VSWEQLRSIVRQNAEDQAYWLAQPPRACPNDGTPLTGGPGGVLHCAHDGYQWPRDPALPGEGGNG
jgi:hypothetical protein